MSRAHALLLFVSLVGLGATVACGGRSPFGSLAYEQTSGPGDGGTGGLGPGGGEPGGAGGLGPGGEGGAGPGGTGGGGGFSPIDCIACVAMNCPETLTCLTDVACLQGVGCVVANCLGGGQPDLMCAMDCFGGDMDAAMAALQAMACMLETCGDSCGGVIPLPGN